MIVLAFVLGLIVGIGFALALVGIAVNKSNNKGDSKASYHHFSDNPFCLQVTKESSSKKFDLMG